MRKHVGNIGLHVSFRTASFGNAYGEKIWEYLAPALDGQDLTDTFVRMGDLDRGRSFCIAFFPRDGRRLHGLHRRILALPNSATFLDENGLIWGPPRAGMTDILAIVRPGLAHVRFDAWSESCLAEALGLGRYAGQFEEQGEFFSLGSWRADVMERNSSSEISLLDNWPQAASLMPVDRGQISPIPMTCYVCITTHPRFTVAHERWFSPRSFLDVKTGSHIRPVQRLPDAAQAFLEHEDLPEGYVSICYNYNDGSLIVLGRRNRIRFWLRVPAGNPDDVTDPTGSEKLARLIPEIEAERSDVVADELGDGLR